jgi:dihydroorotase
VGAETRTYDLLLRGGRVVDPAHGIDAVRDVAIAGGRVAAVEPRIDPALAFKVVDVAGLVVTPGLVDLHTHLYAGTGEKGSYAGDNSVYPDGFTLRTGVTTAVDAGSAGWRNFDDFKDRVVSRAKTRVLAFLNIVGHGMRNEATYEQDLSDMESAPTAEKARESRGFVVGVKTAHYHGPEWTPVERAVEAGTRAGVPVMVDFGAGRPERPVEELVTRKLRPGDIYTHTYSGLRRELLEGRLNPGLLEGRKRGVLFDVGHGGGSFSWGVAVPATREGFWPDTISTDLHISSMNAGMKDLPNVLSKFLALGLPLPEVVRRATVNPARAIGRTDLGHLGVGAPADLAVLRLGEGDFGLVDSFGGRLRARQRLTCEMTLREGKVVFDLNGLARPDWQTLPRDYRSTGDPRWEGR